MPASPSVSYSNRSTAHGSTAPMLPNHGEANHTITHRNKLVKRSSSQRALSNVAAHSTLRRPATSHQRSATLQQHHQLEEGPVQHATPRSSMLIDDLMEEPDSSDDLSRSWQYFFRPRTVRLGKDGPSRVRSATGSVHRNDALTTIVPDVADLPTLLLATSISSRYTEDFTNAHDSLQYYERRPATTAGIPDDNSEERWFETDSGKRKAMPGTDQDLKPRRSFSIADMFSSSSPSTWKIPRSGSLRKAKGAQGPSSGRRVVSAPQSTKPDRTRTMSQSKSSYATHPKSKPVVSRVDHPPPLSANPVEAYSRAPSSPLPPLNRLSSFEIELPGAAPSYPTTPQSDLPLSPLRLSSPPSPLMSSPLAPFSNRHTLRHPSLAISDRGSTLLGSDNDASRILSGDEDESDFRSETAYDSTRTGATGSSHSNIRRPPIEALFGDLPSGDYEKNKSIALQELLSHDSFNTVDVRRNRIAEEEESMTTPVRVDGSKQEQGSPTPVSHDPERVTDDVSPSLAVLGSNSQKNSSPQVEETSVEEVWAIESLDDSERGSNHGKRSLTEATTGRSPSTPNLIGSVTGNTHSLARLEEPSSSSTKANVFEWSESPPVDRDSSSSRPKTVHGRQGKDIRGSRTTARRGPSAMHLRSQSVPVAPDSSNHRTNTSKLEAWVLGNKGVSEDWDTDFEFEEASAGPKQFPSDDGPIRTSISSGMLVPRSILERQASVHGQFGHVKELTILVEELKGLRQQALNLDVMNGLSAELWKEADGIINLATLDDDEHDFLSPRSPNSPGFDVDPFEEDPPAVADRRRSGASPSREHAMDDADGTSGHYTPSYSTPERSRLTTPQGSRPRKESAAKAKSVLETIHQQRSHYSPSVLEKPSQKKLPFDTTSLRDLVTRAGVVTRALKEIIRRAEKAVDGPPLSTAPDSPSDDSPPPPDPPAKPDPAFSQIFQPPNAPASTSKSSKSPRVTQSPKGSNNNFRGATIAGNDNEINGHMKLMTVV
ncbi:MAG: hypothetical protein Q9174_000898 [Haloplaca sp. 1 TL-2023]